MRHNAAEKLSATDLFLVLQKAYRATLAKVELCKKKAGLGDSDFRVLEVLHSRGPSPVNVIGELIGLTTGSITTAVDRMESKWLVVRKRHPNDSRVRLVELTSKGRRLIERASAELAAEMDDLVGCLSQEERATVAALLSKLILHATDESDEKTG